VSGAVIRNAFTVSIFRNPMQEDYMDIYIQSMADLSASPTVLVQTGRDSTVIALDALMTGFFRGGYLLPYNLSIGEKRIAEIHVKGKTKDGKEVAAVTLFGYGRIGSAGGKIALSGFSLEIPPDALRKPELITIIQTAAEGGNAKIGRCEPFLDRERFSAGPAALRTAKPMTVSFRLKGDAAGAGIYRLAGDAPEYVGGVVSNGLITASVAEGGTFAIGYKKNPPQETAFPVALAVGQNMPNPFNPNTLIPFELSHECEVRIEVYDANGRNIASPGEGRFPPGSHAVMWDARDRNGREVSSGAYFYRVTAGGWTVTKKMLFLR